MKKLLAGLLTIIMCFVLVGCGKQEAASFDKVESNTNQSEAKDDTKDNATDDTADDIQLYSDDTKIVFDNGQAKLVYYYSGEKITAYHSYLNYETAATANYALSLIEKDDDTISKAYTKGKYLIIEYAESQYEDLTVSEVKALYSYLKEVQKNN